MTFVNIFNSPEIPKKDTWYRMEERENEKHPIDKSLIGKTVFPFRIIVRCGYWISPVDLDGRELNEAAIDYLAKKLGLNSEVIEGVVYGMTPSGLSYITQCDREKPPGYIAEKVEAGQFGIDDRYVHQLRNVYRKVRQHWLDKERSQKPQEHPINLRTFWYADVERLDFTITGIVTRQIGKYNSGGWSGGYDWEEFDAPYLHTTNTQRLYVAKWLFYENRKIYIHPLDIEGTNNALL